MSRAPGIILLALSCLGLGQWKAFALRERIRQRKALLYLAESLAREIACARTPLPEALGRIAKKLPPPFAPVIAAMAKSLGEGGEESFATALHTAMARIGTQSFLTGEDCAAFEETAARLGYLDAAMQTDLLGAYADGARAAIREDERLCSGRVRLILSLSLLGCACSVILFF